MQDNDQPAGTAQVNKGDTVTLDVRGAWHYGDSGRVLHVDHDRGIVRVGFSGRGAVTAPLAVAIHTR